MTFRREDVIPQMSRAWLLLESHARGEIVVLQIGLSMCRTSYFSAFIQSSQENLGMHLACT